MTVQAHVRRLAALLALVSVLASVVFAGQSVFLCPWMKKSTASCCCPSEGMSSDGAVISRAPCCKKTTLAAVPGAPTDSTRQTSVPAATSFVGELVRVADGGTAAMRITRVERDRHARAGPNAELFELHSAYLI